MSTLSTAQSGRRGHITCQKGHITLSVAFQRGGDLEDWGTFRAWESPVRVDGAEFDSRAALGKANVLDLEHIASNLAASEYSASKIAQFVRMKAALQGVFKVQ
jgi:hypothetical protein